MSEMWHGYVAVERTVANLGVGNWSFLINSIREIDTVNGASQYLLTERGNLDTFVYEGETYSNIYIWEARYLASAIQFENFKIELAILFDTDPDNVTYTIGTAIIRERESVFATYFYNGKKRIRVGLFGCADDLNLCIWRESLVECNGYLDDNAIDWNG